METKPALVCVDGTNVVRCSNPERGPAFADAEERDRRWLAAALADLCERGAGQLEVELYFDGSGAGLSKPAGSPAGFSLRFAYDTQADALILDRVRGRRFAGQRVTVLTADSDLGERAKEEGARWQRFSPGQSLESILGALAARLLRR